MSENESGGTKFLRGLLIAGIIVVALVLLVVFRKQALDALGAAWDYTLDGFPTETGQQVAVIVYLLLAAVMGVLFSQAGHFTAFGVAMGLIPLLWILFWEGFPPVGMDPTWTESMGLTHMAPGGVLLWALVAILLTSIVFVPLELREKFLRRKRSLDTD